jgi:enamine deaminase RidA (YjgF/YER057c/UK114 family)
LPDQVPARNEWGDLYGYSRAVRAGDLIEVAGTTGPGDSAGEQAQAALAAIARALEELGASMDDVVRTRMFVVEISWNGDEVGQVHGEVFGAIKPATAMYGVTALLRPDMLVEIEATAVVDR